MVSRKNPLHWCLPRALSPLLAVLVLVSAVTVPVSPALAQSSKKELPVPPTPGKEDTSRKTILMYLVLVAIFAVVVGVNFIPSKRGHQD